MPVISRDLPIPDRALAIGAHPDDIEFGAGATLAKWAAGGCEVSLLICTDGSKGTWDRAATLSVLVEQRQQEQRSAARELGATGEVVFLGHVDGELASGLTERAQVAEWIRRLRPHVVLGHDPWAPYRLHPDHRHAGFLAVEGLVAARDPHFFAEQGLAHHRPSDLLLFEAARTDHVEDVTGFTDAKLSALETHRSQFESTMFITDTDEADAQAAAFRRRELDRTAHMGRSAGLAHAESFARLPTDR